MKTYIQPQTNLVMVATGQIICASVTTIVSGTGPIDKLGQIYIDIKDAL